jgi:serine/threonine protein phosphatase PrpC
MARTLKISIGQHSDKGRKETNQDFHGALIPEEPILSSKGIAVILADGISSSQVSRVAAESTVKSFLTDYYCTSEAWSVKTSAHRVIAATNSWLHAQTRRGQNPYDKDKGYVCTIAAVVFKSRTAHIFHAGDSRVCRLAGTSLEQLTEDHRLSVSAEESYLSRALGVRHDIELDYRAQRLEIGDVLVLTTDGIHEYVGARTLAAAIAEHADALDKAALTIAEAALERGSTDNLTIQIVRIDELPDGEAGEMLGRADELPLPPLLEPRELFDGYRILRKLHASSRSHLYLALDTETDETVVLKTPSVDLATNKDNLKRFMMEEWVARRISSAHVLKGVVVSRKRNFLYIVTEFVEGQTLAQWMIDNPEPDIETMRGIIEQVARGLQSFHRLEMLHQDLRPANIMIDKAGTVKIIDFGSVMVAGVIESAPAIDPNEILGTAQYTAPEYLLGEGGSPRSDIYSLGVITYQMLSGKLPYGARMASAKTRSQQRKLRYDSILDESRAIPAWIDTVLEKAVHPDPLKRYQEPLEFTYALRHPPKEFLSATRKPLMERNPLLFWKGLSCLLAVAVLVLLAALGART